MLLIRSHERIAEANADFRRAGIRLLRLDEGAWVPGDRVETWAWLDGQEHLCRLQADFVGSERILGRDVLNRLDILFRGPAITAGNLRPAIAACWLRSPVLAAEFS